MKKRHKEGDNELKDAESKENRNRILKTHGERKYREEKGKSLERKIDRRDIEKDR